MIYFVSDIHLGAGDAKQAKRTEQAFCRWLDAIAKDATCIYLMGDIFDFWFEYRGVVPKGFVRTLGRLAHLTERGIEVHLFIGNHDMWCRDYFERECGVKLIFKPQQMRLYGREVFIAHGDNMNISGKPMLRLMNSGFRSKTLRKLFSWLVHPDLAMRFGRWWSEKSRLSHSKEILDVDALDFLVDYARSYKLSNPQTDYIVLPVQRNFSTCRRHNHKKAHLSC